MCCTYPADGYDWRYREAGINALPGYVASVDGTGVFYLRYDAEEPGALPLVLTHGWPSSFLELAPLARRLSMPSRHGGQAADAFTVIVPALPGFPFSPQRPDLPPAVPTEELWHRLMRDELGYLAPTGEHRGRPRPCGVFMQTFHPWRQSARQGIDDSRTCG
ncbi:epoxide hydrolase N-terminal domain-containing protein [Nonomuraea sp. CA-141351]|uniref:epoxide hydrolase family protein n=1 Tax=Nonomuraea sp. CA-141351 TaxID=3239996 RepID=UPI003D944AA9